MRSGIGDPNVDIMGYTMDSLCIKKSFRLENSNPSVGGKRYRGKEDNSTAFNFQFSKKKTERRAQCINITLQRLEVMKFEALSVVRAQLETLWVPLCSIRAVGGIPPVNPLD